MRLVALDSLRGVAALMVVLLHINAVSHVTDWTIVRQAWLFVDFFFVLSGFVIAFIYLEKIENWPSVLEFAIRRFGRVWPLHVFILLLFIASELLKLILSHRGLPIHEPAFTGRYTVDAIVANLFLVHSLGIYGLETWNGPSWSISVEFYTYLIFALSALFARRWIALLALILIALSVLVLCLWAPLYLATTIEFGMARCLYGFFVGVLVALAFGALQRRQWTPRAPTILEAATVALAIALLLGCAASAALTMLAPLVFATVVLVFAFQGGGLSRLLLTSPLVWLGDRSYSIYIVHALVIELLNRGLLIAGSLIGFHALTHVSRADGIADVIFIHDRFATDLFVLVYVGIVLIGSDLAHRAVEQPCRAFFNRVARGYRQHLLIAQLGPELRENAQPITKAPVT